MPETLRQCESDLATATEQSVDRIPSVTSQETEIQGQWDGALKLEWNAAEPISLCSSVTRQVIYSALFACWLC